MKEDIHILYREVAGMILNTIPAAVASGSCNMLKRKSLMEPIHREPGKNGAGTGDEMNQPTDQRKLINNTPHSDG